VPVEGGPSQKSFIFTFKDPHDVPTRTLPLKNGKLGTAIVCDTRCGPSFYDIRVQDNCNTNSESYTYNFGRKYLNETGMQGKTFFTVVENFRANEIEGFEITE
jgi:hypothetical protein